LLNFTKPVYGLVVRIQAVNGARTSYVQELARTNHVDLHFICARICAALAPALVDRVVTRF